MATKHLWSTPLSANDQQPKEQLGALRTEWSTTDECFKTYRYAQNGSAAVTTGQALSFMVVLDAKTNSVSTDISTGSQNAPAGIAIGALTAKYYGWIQTGGYVAGVAVSGVGTGAAVGESAILASTNGSISTLAAGTAPTHRPFGTVVYGATGSSCAVYLTLDTVVQ